MSWSMVSGFQNVMVMNRGGLCGLTSEHRGQPCNFVCSCELYPTLTHQEVARGSWSRWGRNASIPELRRLLCWAVSYSGPSASAVILHLFNARGFQVGTSLEGHSMSFWSFSPNESFMLRKLAVSKTEASVTNMPWTTCWNVVPDLKGSPLIDSLSPSLFFLFQVSNEQKQVWDLLRERCSLLKVSQQCSGLQPLWS